MTAGSVPWNDIFKLSLQSFTLEHAFTLMYTNNVIAVTLLVFDWPNLLSLCWKRKSLKIPSIFEILKHIPCTTILLYSYIQDWKFLMLLYIITSYNLFARYWKWQYEHIINPHICYEKWVTWNYEVCNETQGQRGANEIGSFVWHYKHKDFRLQHS